MNTVPRILVALLIAGAISSGWYIDVCFEQWMAQDLSIMSRGDAVKTITARVLYVSPKLLLIGSVLIVFLRRAWLDAVLSVAWILAGLHTLMFYGAFEVTLDSELEKLRLIVHHVIPHAYFAVLFILYMRKGSRLDRHGMDADEFGT